MSCHMNPPEDKKHIRFAWLLPKKKNTGHKQWEHHQPKCEVHKKKSKYPPHMCINIFWYVYHEKLIKSIQKFPFHQRTITNDLRYHHQMVIHARNIFRVCCCCITSFVDIGIEKENSLWWFSFFEFLFRPSRCF